MLGAELRDQLDAEHGETEPDDAAGERRARRSRTGGSRPTAARVSPSAARTAISWRRPSARTRKRLATLAQPIRKMRPDRAEQDPQRGRDVADHLVAQVAHHRFEAGVGQDRRRRITGERSRQVAEQLVELGLGGGAIDARTQPAEAVHAEHAERRDAPGRPRSGSRPRSRESDTRSPSGITPITSRATLSNWTLRPTMPGSEPNRRSHSR